jgi:hypothetical protein
MSTPTTAQDRSAKTLHRPHRNISGRIAYIDNANREVGREWFRVSVHADGGRTLRATCEMDDDQVLRDVVYAVDGHWRPLDSFVRLTVGGAFMGSTWFRFGEREIEAEGFAAREGRFSQKIAVAHRPPIFASHPVFVDGWQATAFDHAKPERVQSFKGCANSSPLANGASGPMIGMTDKSLEYVGEARVAVPAGAFETRHYRIRPAHYPPMDLWVIPGDFLFVRLAWDYLGTRYDLVELSRD